LAAATGDLTVTGTITANNGGVSLTSDNGSIFAVGAGPHVIASGTSYLSAPNGAVCSSGDPINVNISGLLYLNVSNTSITVPTGNIYGNINGTVSTPLGIPLLVPTSFPSPLLPPGFVYYNGGQIWPTTNNTILQEFASASVNSLKDKFWEALSSSRYVSFDKATPQLYAYHPLNEIDESAFKSIYLDSNSYEFIEKAIRLKKELNPYFGSFEKKKKRIGGAII